jgi:hypothetical protein
VQASPKEEVMKRLILILWCLIAFIPKEIFLQNPDGFVQVFKEIWADKHPGQKNPTVKIGENKLGQVVIEIDQPKQEI